MKPRGLFSGISCAARRRKRFSSFPNSRTAEHTGSPRRAAILLRVRVPPAGAQATGGKRHRNSFGTFFFCRNANLGCIFDFLRLIERCPPINTKRNHRVLTARSLGTARMNSKPKHSYVCCNAMHRNYGIFANDRKNPSKKKKTNIRICDKKKKIIKSNFSLFHAPHAYGKLPGFTVNNK